MRIFARLRASVRENISLLIIAFLIILFVIVYFWHNIFISIKPGEAGVLYRRFLGGTVVDRVYAEGFHIILPWDLMTIYNVRYQVIRHQMDALTQKGLKIQIHLTVRYQPEYRLLGVLHQAVGPDYPDKIVIPETEAVIRQIVGRFEADEIYSTQRALIQQILNDSVNQISQRFVKVDDVIITKVELPQTIQEAIQSKMEQRELAAAYEFRLQREEKEAERKRIEAKGLADYNRTVDASLTDKILTWKGVQATLELSASKNAKVVIIGAGKNGLPIILDTKDWAKPADQEGAGNQGSSPRAGQPSTLPDKGKP